MTTYTATATVPVEPVTPTERDRRRLLRVLDIVGRAAGLGPAQVRESPRWPETGPTARHLDAAFPTLGPAEPRVAAALLARLLDHPQLSVLSIDRVGAEVRLRCAHAATTGRWIVDVTARIAS